MTEQEHRLRVRRVRPGRWEGSCACGVGYRTRSWKLAVAYGAAHLETYEGASRG